MYIIKNMLRAYKYRLYPTPEQEILLAKTFGCVRFVYNWALGLKIQAYREEKKTLGNVYLANLMKSELKNEKEWLSEVNSQALQMSLRNLETAYSNFFRSTRSVGFPKFKSKKNNQSFQCPQHCKVDFKDNILTIPKIKDIKAVFHRQFTGTIKTVTISKTGSEKYFASILVDTTIESNLKVIPAREATVGIDLGLKTLAVCSDGQTFSNNKHLSDKLDRIVRLQRLLSKKMKGSSNRNKARKKVARLQERVSNMRKDDIHKATYGLTHNPEIRTICMEDLNVKGMMKNHHLAQALNDASFGMFRTMLEYKCEWYGINLMKIDRFAPSSKTCSQCGHVYKGLKLSERSWMCTECGTLHDRDLNAACNVKEFGLKALSTERGEVKPVEKPTVDDRSQEPKKQCFREAGKVRIFSSDAHAFRRG